MFNKKAEITGRALASKMDEVIKSKEHAQLFGKVASEEVAEILETEEPSEANVVQEAFETILAMSDVFEEYGFDKTAAVALQLADGLIAEAAKKAKSKESDKKSDKKSEKKTLKDHLKSKSKKDSEDDKKKSDKKDDKKKSDKK